MADVRLHRADQERTVGFAAATVDGSGGLHLDGIAQFRTGAVRFQVVHLRRLESGPGQGVLDHAFLGGAVRHGQSRRGAALVERRAAQHCPDPVAVGLRLGETLQRHHAAALAAHETVRGGVEGAAASTPRQQPQFRHEPRHAGRQHGVRPAGKGKVRLAALQARYRLVQRRERRRAGQVQRDGRPRQAQHEGDPADGDARTGAEVADIPAALGDRVAILAAAQTRIDPGATALEGRRIDSRVLERPPAHLEQQPLARIHRVRLDRPDAEEPGVEPVDPVDEAAAACGAVAGRPACRRTGPAVGVPPPVRDRGLARFELAPIRLEVGRTGEPARHPHDRDRIVFAPRSPRRGQRRFGRRRRRLPGVAEFSNEMAGESGDVRIVEHERVRRRVDVGERAVQAVPELDRHQRVHAQIEEADGRRRRRGQPEHRLDLALQEGDENALPLLRRRLAEAVQHVVRGGVRLVPGAGNGEKVVEQGRAALDRLAKGRPVGRQYGGRCGVLPQQAVERLEAPFRTEPAGARRLAPPGDPFALLLGLAEPRPCPPGDGLSRESKRSPVRGELVEEGVRRRVVGLARIAENAGHAGEEDEQIQVPLHRRAVQMPGPEHLRPQHGLEAPPALVAERRVGEHADAVEDAPERRQLPVHPRQHRVDRREVRDVGKLHAHLEPPVAKRFDRLPGGGIGFPAAVQHDGARAPLRQPLGQRATDAAETSRDQVRPVLPEPARPERRQRQDDLPLVAGRAHVLHRGARLGQRPPRVDRRDEFAGPEAGEQLAQGGARLFGIALLQPVQVEDGVGDVRAQRRHLVLAQDVPSGQLHEPSIAREAGEARLDEALAGQAVQHDVDARSVRGVQDLLPERRRAAVEHVLDAQRTEVRLLGSARRGEHLGPCSLGELDRREPDAARARVNQHAVSGLEFREFVREHARHEDGRNRRERGRRHVRRRRRDQLLVRHDLRPERAEREAGHPVADRHGRHLGAGLDHPAAELFAEIPLLLDEAHRPEHVQEVQAAGIDRDPHFLRPQGRPRPRLHPQRLDRASLVRRQHPAGFVRQGEALRAGAHPHQPGHVPVAAAPGDVVLGVGEQEFLGQAGVRRRQFGVEVDHPRLQVGHLAHQDLAETPERRAGQLAAAFPFQHLRAAGGDPDALLRRRVRVGDALHEGQRGRRRLSGVRGHLLRRRLLAVPVLGHEMHDAGQGRVAGQIAEEVPPRLPALHVDRPRDHRGILVRAVLVRPRCVRRQHYPLIAGRELLGQRGGRTAPVSGQDPEALGRSDLRRRLRHDHPAVGRGRVPIGRRRGIRLVDAQNVGFAETGVRQGLPPDVRPRQGMVGAVTVVEAPPAVQLPEDQVHPASAALVLERHQQSRRRQQLPAVRERLVQVLRRVQDVGRDDEVGLVRGEALVDRVLLDVEHPVVDPRVPFGEARFRFREETGRYVRVDVVEVRAAKSRQNAVGRGADAGADLEHAEAPLVRQPGHERLDELSEHPVRGHPHGRPAVEIAGLGLGVAEQERQRVLAAAKHRGQSAGAALEQPDLVDPVRVPPSHLLQERLAVPRHALRQRIAGAGHHHEALAVFAQHAGTSQDLQDPAEQPGVLRQRLQALAERLRRHRLARPALPTQRFQRRQGEAPGQPLQVVLQSGLFVHSDSLGRQVVGERLRLRRRFRGTGEEVGRQHSGPERPVPPHDLVEQLLHSFHGRKQRRPGRPLHRISHERTDGLAVRVVEVDVRAQHLRRLVAVPVGRAVAPFLPHAYAAEDPGRQLAAQQQSFPAERQVGDSILSRLPLASRGHDLEAAVEQQRMDLQPLRSRRRGEGHLAERLARPAPDRLEGAERGTEIDPDRGLGPVERLQVDLREARLQPFEVGGRTGRRQAFRRRLRDHALRVQGPALVVLALAEDLDPARGVLSRSIEQDLHGALRPVGAVA